MSIKFICSCGKHLRARDEMAARRSICPRCGNPVGVPSQRPTHAGTAAAPLTPQERRRLNRNKPRAETGSDSWRTGSDTYPVEDAFNPAANAAGSPASPPTRKVRRRRQLEQHWHECLAYPFLNWKVILLFSFLLSVTMAGIVLSIPSFPAFSLASLHTWFPWACSVLLVVPLVALAYATLECALTSALAGEGPAPFRPAWNSVDPLKSSVRWLFCFYAGPIVPVALAIYLCVYGGDLTMLDWGIVTELSVFAAGYWFLAVVSANERNHLRDANPARVAQLVQRLKYRAVTPVLIAPALAFFHALVVLFALSSLHEHGSAWLLLMICWCSILFWSAFLFRLLGVWCYRNPPLGVGK